MACIESGSRSSAILLWGLLLICGGAEAVPQLQAQERGSRVRVLRDTSLKVEGTILGQLAAGTDLTVETVQGEWLWVRTGTGQSGWIRQTDAQVLASSGSVTSTVPSSPPQPEAQYLVGWLLTSQVITLHDQLLLLHELQQVQTSEIDRLLKRTGVVLVHIQKLQELLNTAPTAGTSPLDKQVRSDLLPLLAAIEAEAQALQSLIRFPSTESRDAFAKAQLKAEQLFKQISQDKSVEANRSTP